MSPGARLRAVVAAIGALCACSAKYLISGTVSSPDGAALPGVLVAPRVKCGGEPMPTAYSKHTDGDGGYQSGFTYASDHTAVEFTKADYQKKCVDLAPLWKRDCAGAAADGGVTDRCATVDVTLAPAKPPGTDAPAQHPAPAPLPPAEKPPAQPPDARPAPMTD